MARLMRPCGVRWQTLSPALSTGYNSGMAKDANGSILERFLEPVVAALNDEAARKLIGLRADRTAQARVDELARKCNEDELSAERGRNHERANRS